MLTHYRITKTFTAGLLTGITTHIGYNLDGPCRFIVGQTVKAFGGGSYRVESVEVL